MNNKKPFRNCLFCDNILCSELETEVKFKLKKTSFWTLENHSEQTSIFERLE